VIAWQQRYPRVHWWLCPGRAFAEVTTYRILERYWRDTVERDGETATDLRAALRDLCEAERRWRQATEASGRLAADAALRHAAARGRRGCSPRTAASSTPAGQWIEQAHGGLSMARSDLTPASPGPTRWTPEQSLAVNRDRDFFHRWYVSKLRLMGWHHNGGDGTWITHDDREVGGDEALEFARRSVAEQVCSRSSKEGVECAGSNRSCC
jgi:hypothetical protein